LCLSVEAVLCASSNRDLHSNKLVRSETGATDNKLKLKPIVAFMHRLLHYAPMTKRKACENQKKAQKQDKQRLTEHKEQEKKQQQIEMSQVKSSVAIKSRKRTSNSGLSEPMEVVSQLDVQMSQCSMQEEFDNFEGKPSKTSHIIRPNIEHLHELPQELLAHILSWLNVQDLLVAERVCLLWKRLMRDFDSLVWRPICMRKWESEEPCALLVESWREAWFRGNKTMPSHLIKMKKLCTSQNNYLAITGGITALPSIFFSMFSVSGPQLYLFCSCFSIVLDETRTPLFGSQSNYFSSTSAFTTYKFEIYEHFWKQTNNNSF